MGAGSVNSSGCNDEQAGTEHRSESDQRYGEREPSILPVRCGLDEVFWFGHTCTLFEHASNCRLPIRGRTERGSCIG